MQNLNYSFSLSWSAEDQEYAATCAEFPGLSSLSEDPEEALSDLRSLVAAAVDVLEEEGDPLPSPIELEDYSGQLRLRLPRWMHREAADRAQREGVSLNALLQAFIATALGRNAAVDVTKAEIGRLTKSLEQLVDSFVPRKLVPGFNTEHPRRKVSYSLPNGEAASDQPDVIAIEAFLKTDQQTRSITDASVADVPALPEKAFK